MPRARSFTAVAARDLRPSGLTPVPEVPWGEHMSAFFDTADDLFEIAADFFEAGLGCREKCLWLTSKQLGVGQVAEKLRKLVPDFQQRLAAGAVEILRGTDWYLTHDQLDSERASREWRSASEQALNGGFEGLRVLGNPFWLQNSYWTSFRDYEAHLSREIAGERVIVLCVYPLREATAADVLDITKAHDFSIVRRERNWEFLESPDQVIARREIDRLQNALEVLSLPFPGREKLTPRERLTLAQIVRGASNKEAARALEISPRTIEFHRANIMRKLGVHNLAELMAVVLSAFQSRRTRASRKP